VDADILFADCLAAQVIPPPPPLSLALSRGSPSPFPLAWRRRSCSSRSGAPRSTPRSRLACWARSVASRPSPPLPVACKPQPPPPFTSSSFVGQADCLRAQGRHYEAHALYRGAAVVFRRCKLAHQATAGLARVAYGRGELMLACGRAQVLAYLLQPPLVRCKPAPSQPYPTAFAFAIAGRADAPPQGAHAPAAALRRRPRVRPNRRRLPPSRATRPVRARAGRRVHDRQRHHPRRGAARVHLPGPPRGEAGDGGVAAGGGALPPGAHGLPPGSAGAGGRRARVRRAPHVCAQRRVRGRGARGARQGPERAGVRRAHRRRARLRRAAGRPGGRARAGRGRAGRGHCAGAASAATPPLRTL